MVGRVITVNNTTRSF